MQKPLEWLLAYFSFEVMPLQRSFFIDAPPVHLTMQTDASTYGIGAVLLHNASHRPLQYFTDPITIEDERKLHTHTHLEEIRLGCQSGSP
eukprot:2176763-Amphidinium_carterae.1